jgi:hypothetical protein
MNAIQIVNVERDGDDGILVTFSDGTIAGYIAEELIDLRPVRERVSSKLIVPGNVAPSKRGLPRKVPACKSSPVGQARVTVGDDAGQDDADDAGQTMRDRRNNPRMSWHNGPGKGWTSIPKQDRTDKALTTGQEGSKEKMACC